MANPSNLYADKILQQHPLALWTLDSDVSYLSLITDAQRDFTTGWTLSGSFLAADVNSSQSPFYKLHTEVTELYNNSVSTGTTFTATSTTTFTAPSDTFSIGLYVLKTTPFISSIRIGYKIGAGATVYSSAISVSSDMYDWQFVSATFATAVTGANIVIEFTYSTPSPANKVGIMVNGLTVGTFAEDSNMVSTGLQKTAISTINTTQTFGLLASQYVETLNTSGTYSNKYGYYIVNGNVAYARNTGHPLVFGCTNSTRLYPYTANEPSLLLPGYGFLNEVDKYKTRTYEMWLKINSSATSIKRVMGPIGSYDGLYVDNANMILKIGDNISSYYVGEWDRPMLVQITTSRNGARMFVNGDVVIEMPYDVADVTFADYKSSTLEQDWIGFYAHSDIGVEVSCVAVYDYEVEKGIALSRFTYGQALKFPQDKVSYYSGESVVQDSTYSNYASKVSIGVGQRYTWGASIYDNFITNKDTLANPNFLPPTIQVEPSSTKTQEDMFTVLSGVAATYIDLQPDSTWNGVESHIFFPTLNPITAETDLFYVVFDKSENNSDTKQILFKIYNEQDGNYLEANTFGATGRIYYSFYYNGTTTALYDVAASSIGTKYAAGISISRLVANSNKDFNAFFANKQNLKVYVGGSNDFANDTTLTGKVYRVGFGDARNFSKVSSSFTAAGFYTSAPASALDTHIANYTMVVRNFLTESFIDIAVNSYWLYYIPLTRLGKQDPSTNTYILDYVQFNVDYPSQISTTDADVKTYVTFAATNGTTHRDILDPTFANTVVVDSTRYLDISSAWTNTKYQVVDGTVIYVPTDVSFTTLAMQVHIESNSEGIRLNPINIRTLSLTGQGLGTDTNNPRTVGTKTGKDLIPFGTGDNPILISQFDDPYYYLTSQSGFRVVGTNSAIRGHYIHINKEKYENFSIGAIQMSMKIPVSQFSTTETLLFEIENVDTSTSIKFYIDAYNTAQNRAAIYAKDQAGNSYTSLQYFLNGTQVDRVIVSNNEWFSLGVKFTSDVSLNNYAGKIKFVGPQIINHFEYFQPKTSQRASFNNYYNWANVLYSSTGTKNWNYYTNTMTITAVSPSTPSVGSVRYTASNTFAVGDVILISGLAPSGYNGTFTVTAATSSNFTVANSTTATVTDASGTATIPYWLSVASGTASTSFIGTQLDNIYDVFSGTGNLEIDDSVLATVPQLFSYKFFMAAYGNSVTPIPL